MSRESKYPKAFIYGTDMHMHNYIYIYTATYRYMETLETPIAHPIPPNFNPINHKHPSYVKLHMGTWTFRKLRASECLEPQHSLTLNPEP